MDNKRTYYKKWWFWGIGVICIVFVVIATTSSTKNNSVSASNIATSSPTQSAVASATASPAKTVTQAATPSPTPTKTPQTTVNYYKSGMYKVGTDIPAGEYVIMQDSSYCYFNLTKDSTGESSSIIAVETIYSRGYVTLSNGQYLSVSGGLIYPIKDAPKFTVTDGKYSSGEYKVGVDIPAGEYKVISDSSYCYMKVTKNSTKLTGSIVSIKTVDPSSYVTVKNGQYLTIVGGYINAK